MNFQRHTQGGNHWTAWNKTKKTLYMEGYIPKDKKGRGTVQGLHIVPYIGKFAPKSGMGIYSKTWLKRTCYKAKLGWGWNGKGWGGGRGISPRRILGIKIENKFSI